MTSLWPVFWLSSSVTCFILAAYPLWLWLNLSNRMRNNLLQGIFQRYANFIRRLAGKKINQKAADYLAQFEAISKLKAEEYLAFKTIGLISGGLLGLIIGKNWAFVLASLGFILPNMFLKQRLKSWRALFYRQFPFALDLLSLIVSSGTGLQAALEEVAANLPQGPLRSELWRVMGHLTLGASLEEALAEFSQRSGVEEVQSPVAALVQAQQLGTELGGVLQVLVGSMRERTNQEAEERSQLLPLKMLVPLLFFIFPALLILLFAPLIMSGYLIF